MRSSVLSLVLSLLFFISFFGKSQSQSFRRFTPTEGIASTAIVRILQDKNGFLWLATASGLYRYDSHRFKIFKHIKKDPSSLPANYLRDIALDRENNIWAITLDGISFFHSKTERFTNFSAKDFPKDSPMQSGFYTIIVDRTNRIWASTRKGIFEIHKKDGKLSFSGNLLSGFKKSSFHSRNLVEDQQGVFWISSDEGLLRINKDGSNGKLFLLSSGDKLRYENGLQSIFIDRKNNIWVGSAKNGLFSFDRYSEKFREIASVTDALQKKNTTVFGLAQDKQGSLWVATLDGLVQLNPETGKATAFQHRKDDPGSLPDNGLLSVYCDSENGIWLGSYYTGLAYINPSFLLFQPWPVPWSDPRSIDFGTSWIGTTLKDKRLWIIPDSKKEILFFDETTGRTTTRKLPLPADNGYDRFQAENETTLWCAVSSLLSKVDLTTGKRKDFPFPVENGQPVTGRTWIIVKNTRGKFWIGGDYGLFQLDETTGILRRITGVGSLFSHYVDTQNNVWFSGLKGDLYVARSSSPDKVEKQQIISDDPEIPLSQIWQLTGDPSGRIWLAMGENHFLLEFDKRTRKVIPLYNDELTDHDFPYDLQRDAKGYIWMSNDTKLIRFHPDLKTTQVYTSRDGLPTEGVLRPKGSAQTAGGQFFFGTSEGLVRFNPAAFHTRNQPSPLVPTSLRLLNYEVKPGDSTGILPTPIYNAQELTFQHFQKSFTLDFSLLSFTRSYENRYAYKLDGVDKDWNYSQTPSVTYSNLPDGDYTLLIRAANGDGYWNPKPTKISISILPPWWRTHFAYFLYFLAFALSLYFLIRYFWIRSSLQKEASLYQTKLDFFTNVSHEIRTHLSLIVAPLEKAFDLAETTEGTKAYLTFARSNSQRLMTLVNELLDFRKMESGKVLLHVGEHNLIHALRSTLSAFQHVAEQKNIALHFHSARDVIFCWFDALQMQKVFFNLIGNAVKFTPEGGHIALTVRETDAFLFVDFLDTGRGIAPEHLENLFRNFFQVYDAEQHNTGYGIGLALSREIVLQHGGDLSVKSNTDPLSPDHGSCFTLRLPKGKAHFDPSFVSENPALIPADQTPIPVEVVPDDTMATNSSNKHTVLLIEDNEELRVFCREALRDKYNILEAGTGPEGLDMALEHVPDLVVCDVMMPGMDGLEVCRRLKSELATSHIPVLLLTAKTSVPSILKGLTVGADDYITKPFHLEVLSLKISNHIQIREKLRSRYLQHASGHVTPEAEYTQEDQFLAELKTIIENGIVDQEFGVDKLAFRAGLSVSALYRKLRALTGITVNDFIKTIRMGKALELIESGRYQIGEVAMLVGFDDPKYFSREFRKAYGKLPSDVRRKTD